MSIESSSLWNEDDFFIFVSGINIIVLHVLRRPVERCAGFLRPQAKKILQKVLEIKFYLYLCIRIHYWINGPGRFPVKNKAMAKVDYTFINEVTKTNGNNHYDISICHVVYDTAQIICFKTGTEEAKEFYRVHYSWKNAKRSMFNLTLAATKTLAESQRMLEKKIKDLEEKIK